jgi:hypothetical protein
VQTYYVPCNEILKNGEELKNFQICESGERHQLPHISFFYPDFEDFNPKIPNSFKMKDYVYQGVFSTDELIKKVQELIPNWVVRLETKE